MSRYALIELARKAGVIEHDGCGYFFCSDTLSELLEFAALVAAAEREACACYALIAGKDAPAAEERDMAQAIADAIRARGAQGESDD